MIKSNLFHRNGFTPFDSLPTIVCHLGWGNKKKGDFEYEKYPSAYANEYDFYVYLTFNNLCIARYFLDIIWLFSI